MRQVLLAVAAPSLALAACNDPTNPERAVEVTLIADREAASPARPVQITVTVVNRLRRAVHLMDACTRPFVVLDPAGRVRVPPIPFVCASITVVPAEIPPGESLVLRDRWSGETTNEVGAPAQLSPGRYQLAASVFAWTRDSRLVRNMAPVAGSPLSSSPVDVVLEAPEE